MNIYAKNCIVKIISEKTAEKFLKDYHLQGSCEGQLVCLGLFYTDELVGIMTFGYPRYNHNAAWELLRLCYKKDVFVVGGTQKLFNYFLGTKKPDNILSYCNLDLFSGKIYEELKFKKLGSPTESFKWVKGDRWISDAQLRKYGADKLIGTTDGKGTSNEEIMRREGWIRTHFQTVQVYIWDSYIEGIIYKITNNINKKCYIGQSRHNDDRRWYEHCSYGAADSIIDKAIKKYGKENFTYEVIDKASTFYELNKKEQAWIAKLKPEYNIRAGGYNTYIRTISEENKQKLRLSSAQYWDNLDNRKRMSDRHKGVPLSQEHRLAISAGARRAIATPETQARRKQAEQHRKPCSEETKKRLSEIHKAIAASPEYVPTCGNAGHTHTEETKQAISVHSKSLWQDPEYREKMIQKRKEQAQHIKGSVHWYNNGEIQIMASVCPEGFIKGRLKKVSCTITRHKD